MSLGLLHQLEGKVQEACADYEKALTADPSNAKAKQLFSLAVEQFSMIMYSVCKQTRSGFISNFVHQIGCSSGSPILTTVILYLSRQTATNSQIVLRNGLHRDQRASNENVEIDCRSSSNDLESVPYRYLSTNDGVVTSVDLFSHISKKHTITII